MRDIMVKGETQEKKNMLKGENFLKDKKKQRLGERN